MHGVLYLAALAAITALTAGQDDVQLLVTPPGIIKQGQTLNITCVFPNMGAFDVVKIIRIVDVNHEGEMRKKTITLATNNMLNELNPQDRYRLDSNFDTKTYSLIIQDVQGGDGGEIGCEHQGKVNGKEVRNEAMEFFTVYVPVTRVELRASQDGGDFIPVMDGEKVVLREGHDDGVQCVVEVEGSDPDVKPKVHFTIGNVDMTTHQGVHHEAKSSVSLAADQTRDLSFLSQYEFVSEKPPRHLDGHTVTCSAKIQHHDLISKTAEVNVHYEPEVTCLDTVFARVGADAALRCLVKMNPAATHSAWSFQGEDGLPVVLQTHEELNFTTASVTEKGAGEYEFSLVFSKVSANNFMDYTFSVDNGLANIEKTMKFVEDEEPETEPPTTTTTTTQIPIEIDIVETEKPSDPNMNAALSSAVTVTPLLLSLVIAAMFAHQL